jgi:hypothetical protein
MKVDPQAPRISTFTDFWPKYLGEHRDPRSRWLHFCGTSGFLATLLAAVAQAPLRMGLALLASAVIFYLSRAVEARRSGVLSLLAVVVLCAVANPMSLGAVVFAYAFAWAGHFLIEKNRPATFTYPLWSLAGDMRMVSLMWRGQLWRGDPLAAGASVT